MVGGEWWKCRGGARSGVETTGPDLVNGEVGLDQRIEVRNGVGVLTRGVSSVSRGHSVTQSWTEEKRVLE